MINSVNLKRFYEDFYEVIRCKLSIRKHIKEFQEKTEKWVLSKEQKKEILEFYRPYHKPSLVFHNFYTDKTGDYYVNYLPDDIYYGYVDPYFNKISEAKVMDNKCLYRVLFNGIKQPEMIVYRMNGFWYDKNGELIKKSDAFTLISNEKDAFVKAATESFGGHGVCYISSDDGDILEQLCQFLKKVTSDVVIQKPIKQHEALSKLNSSSVNTIRLFSVLSESGVKIYSSILRMGANGSKVDNEASGGFTCGILPNGCLKHYGHNKKGVRYEKHTTSGIVFDGYRIEGYEKAVQLVMKAHPMIPRFRMVSWDIAIDAEGEPILVEANLCQGGLNINQINNGPIFGEDTKKILDEVFKKNG